MHKDYKFSFLNFLGSMLIEGLAILLAVYVLSQSGSETGIATIGLILGLLGIAPTFVVYKRFWLKLFFACLGSGFFSSAMMATRNNWFYVVMYILSMLIVIIDLLIVCFVPNLVINVKTTGGAHAIKVGSQKSIFLRDTGDDYSGFAEVLPWEDTVMAMNEIGTMIDDLQKQGDYAIEKWAK